MAYVHTGKASAPAHAPFLKEPTFGACVHAGKTSGLKIAVRREWKEVIFS